MGILHRRYCYVHQNEKTQLRVTSQRGLSGNAGDRYGKPETVAYPLGFSIKSLKVTHVDCDSHSSPAAIDHRAESLPRQDLLLKTIGICGNAGIQRVSPSPCATVWPMTRRW